MTTNRDVNEREWKNYWDNATVKEVHKSDPFYLKDDITDYDAPRKPAIKRERLSQPAIKEEMDDIEEEIRSRSSQRRERPWLNITSSQENRADDRAAAPPRNITIPKKRKKETPTPNPPPNNSFSSIDIGSDDDFQEPPSKSKIQVRPPTPHRSSSSEKEKAVQDSSPKEGTIRRETNQEKTNGSENRGLLTRENHSSSPTAPTQIRPFRLRPIDCLQREEQGQTNKGKDKTS
ncbi:hypothetical protein PROFUN_02487 [Planoprotostelium fungivorum]|uniref:Uncharacterized protein n=1 Tax=Planoprotostelium fungivorum TaxID=1890364 RepID=A0A2P6MP33_9EUKA|nr:hypothetical protein PROFUN_02487 [Planoprotostelium fungivorum]